MHLNFHSYKNEDVMHLLVQLLGLSETSQILQTRNTSSLPFFCHNINSMKGYWAHGNFFHSSSYISIIYKTLILVTDLIPKKVCVCLHSPLIHLSIQNTSVAIKEVPTNKREGRKAIFSFGVLRLFPPSFPFQVKTGTHHLVYK